MIGNEATGEVHAGRDSVRARRRQMRQLRWCDDRRATAMLNAGIASLVTTIAVLCAFVIVVAVRAPAL